MKCALGCVKSSQMWDSRNLEGLPILYSTAQYEIKGFSKDKPVFLEGYNCCLEECIHKLTFLGNQEPGKQIFFFAGTFGANESY